nr:hypothetical protein pmam_146 [Pithovirus mammoth]
MANNFHLKFYRSEFVYFFQHLPKISKFKTVFNPSGNNPIETKVT